MASTSPTRDSVATLGRFMPYRARSPGPVRAVSSVAGGTMQNQGVQGMLSVPIWAWSPFRPTLSQLKALPKAFWNANAPENSVLRA